MAMVLVYAAVSRDGGSDGGTVSAGTAQIVVAARPIKQRQTITAQDVTIKAVPESNVIGLPFTTLEDVVGKVTRFPIDANQQVTGTAIVDTTRPAADAALSLVVPTGKRAMSIKATQVSNAGGLILPGDYVDLVWICCEGRAVLARTVIQNVQVAAIAQSIVDAGPAAGGEEPVVADGGEPEPEAVTMTLLLTPDEAHLLFLAESTGEIRANLRGIGDVDRAAEDFTLVLELVPLEIINQLPEELRPDGYRPVAP
jgi:pilus assembly protein CpaB